MKINTLISIDRMIGGEVMPFGGLNGSAQISQVWGEGR